MKDFIKAKRKALVAALRQRAKLKNIPFDLEWTDIIYPNYCPVLGIELNHVCWKRENYPSVDRIDNTKGYTKDNIIIVSQRANRLKNDATIDELQKIAEFYKKYEKK